MGTRADQATDSWYDFRNYITLGSFDLGQNMSTGLQYNAENMLNSPADFANWLTIGGVDTINAVINLEESFSKEHWLASFWLASTMVGGAKIPGSNATKPASVAKANPVTKSPKASFVPLITKLPRLNTLTNVREWFRVNVPEIGLVTDDMGRYYFVVMKGDGGSGFGVSGGKGIGKYLVGAYKDIKGVKGIDAHHAGQKAVMMKLVDNYDPNSALKELIELNKKSTQK